MNRKIGAHVSASGGIEKAVERASIIGANCLQIFSGSPRVWKRAPLGNFNIYKFFAKQQELSIAPVFTHSLYLVNLASDNEELLRKSFDVLKYDLEFDALIGGSGIVVHLGSHQKRGFEAVKNQVAEQIAKLLEITSGSSAVNSHFLIENSAGQSGKLCSDLSEIKWLMDQVKSTRLGWCLDTCHAHAAGYALGKEQAETSITAKVLPDEIEKFGLWESLSCIHVNDSRDDFDSGRDRHENIGDGKILKSDLSSFLNLEKVKNIPIITEAPGLDGNGPDLENINRLKTIVGE